MGVSRLSVVVGILGMVVGVLRDGRRRPAE